MSDYKRLTDKEHRYKYCAKCTYRNCQYCDEEMYLDVKAYERLDELEDKIENGTLVELPLPLGAECYSIIDWNSQSGAFVGKRKFDLLDFALYWGKITFATKAEAEAKLEELKRGQK